MINSTPSLAVNSTAKKSSPPKLDRNKTVAILGSSRNSLRDKEYIEMAKEVAKELADKGYNVITGGGYSIMEAANKGAWNINPQKSWAVNAKAFLDKHLKKIFNTAKNVDTSINRTNVFRDLAKYWVVFPGGFGCLQELSIGGESKYYKFEPYPERIVLVGRKFQKPLMDYLKNMDEINATTNAEKIYELADSKNEIIEKVVGKTLDSSV